MRATLFDYGAGNLHSLLKAVGGLEVRVETDPLRALDTDLLLLPGVGAFDAAAERLGSARGKVRAALAEGLPCLGICLGMQLLFESSDEGTAEGLGLIPGTVRRLSTRRTPHIGWNEIESVDPAFAELPIGYYAHGFACRPEDPSCVIAWTTHEEERFPAAVRVGRTLGVQFHPEKSSAAGVRFLRRAVEALTR